MKNLNPEEFSKLLVSLSACKEASVWAEGKSLAEVWSTCHRGDWMLWLIARYGDVSHKALVAIACDCAEPTLSFIPSVEHRPAECLATVRRWLKDETTIEEVKKAAQAAWAAAAWAAAAAQAAWAAQAAAWAAWAAQAAAWAAQEAAWAAQAAAKAAWAAQADSLKFSADVCRKYVTIEENIQ